MRATFAQFRQSMISNATGICPTDAPTLMRLVNRAQPMLVMAGGETGFWGGWQKAVFNVDRCNPYITLPPQFARAINMDVCRFPIRLQNQFFEYLPDGIGLQDFRRLASGAVRDWCGALEGYERQPALTMVDLTPTNQILQVWITDSRDVGKTLIVGPCKDQNGNYIYSTLGNNNVNGVPLTFSQPFTESDMVITSFDGIQKDITYGDVLLYQKDATTGALVLLARYLPWETNPSYRRYYIHKLPCTCGGGPCLQSPCVSQQSTPQIPVSALVKLEALPIMNDTDFLVIQNLNALIEECKSVIYSDQDAKASPAFEAKCHAKAIKLLNDELRHYMGTYQPAINVAPFGTASLARPMSAVANG